MHVSLLICRKLWLPAHRSDKRWQKHRDCDRKTRKKRIQPFTQTGSGNYWRYGGENVQHGNEVCHAQARILGFPGKRETRQRNCLLYKEWLIKEKEIATSNSVRFYITLSFSLNKESPLIGLILNDQRDLELYFLKDLCPWKRSVFSLVQSCYFVNESVLMCLL